MNVRRLAMAAEWGLVAVFTAILFFSMPAPVAAALTAAAMALGVIARRPLANLLNGVWIRHGSSVSLGDYVRIEGHADLEGTVAAVGLQQTTILTQRGDAVKLPNRTFADCAFTNFNLAGGPDGIAIDIDAGRRAKASLVKAIFVGEAETAVRSIPGIIPGTCRVKVLPGRLPQSRRYVMHCRVNSPAGKDDVQADLSLRVARRLQRCGIPILTMSPRWADEES